MISPEEVRKAGLCASCRRVKRVGNRRGSSFFLCTRSYDDDRYPRYPRLPVLRCAGYEPVPERGSGGSEEAGDASPGPS